MKKLLLGLTVVGAMAVPGLASAQVVVGPALSYHDDADFGIGAFVTFPLEELDENVSMMVDFAYFFPDGVDVDYWEINGNVVYDFPVAADTPVLPFVLGGLNIAHVSNAFEGNTEIGINLGAGIEFPSESFNPMVGIRVELEGGEGFVLFGGLGFPVN